MIFMKETAKGRRAFLYKNFMVYKDETKYILVSVAFFCVLLQFCVLLDGAIEQ